MPQKNISVVSRNYK